MDVIYFGGAIDRLQTKDVPHHLDAVSSREFRCLFDEWVVQCWMLDNIVPNDEQSLASFDIDDLIPHFRERWIAGDWKRVVTGRGVTLEEYVMWLQLIKREPIAIILVTEQLLISHQPIQSTGRIRHKLLLPQFEIGACIIRHLYTSQTVRENEEVISIPIMLFDGNTGHIITARSVDESKNLIGYDDPTWPDGSSMLCAGQNMLGVGNAKYYGSKEIGQWAASVIDISALTYAVPIFNSFVPIWTEWAKDARKQMDKLFGPSM